MYPPILGHPRVTKGAGPAGLQVLCEEGSPQCSRCPLPGPEASPMEQGPLAETSRLDEEAVVRAPRGFPGLAGGIPVGPLFVVRVWSPHPSLRALTLTPRRTWDSPLPPAETPPLTPPRQRL